MIKETVTGVLKKLKQCYKGEKLTHKWRIEIKYSGSCKFRYFRICTWNKTDFQTHFSPILAQTRKWYSKRHFCPRIEISVWFYLFAIRTIRQYIWNRRQICLKVTLITSRGPDGPVYHIQYMIWHI